MRGFSGLDEDLTKTKSFCYNSTLILCALIFRIFPFYPTRSNPYPNQGGNIVNAPQNRLESIIEKHHSDKKNLIAMLLDIQEEFHYLSPDSLRYVARALGLPLIDVIGVATFYRAFSLTPRGEHTCLVCMGTACHVRGALKIQEEFERRLDIKSGETTPDGRFTLETVACLGCCAIGPVVTMDGEYFGHTSIRKVNTILKKYQRGEKAAPRAEESPAS